MNSTDYINKAIHAINTDQPNLAMLYMKRGIEVSKEARWKAIASSSPLGPAAVAVERLADVFGAIIDTIAKATESVADVFDAFAVKPREQTCACTMNNKADDCDCDCHDGIAAW